MLDNYIIDSSKSRANFSVKHMLISKVHGEFQKITGKFSYDPDTFSQSMVEAKIETASINTHDAHRDGYLKSAEFLDIEKYPSITFRSTRMHRVGSKLLITGNLTIHGVAREVCLEVTGPSEKKAEPRGPMIIEALGSTKIKRKDFGLTWNAALEAGGFLVGDEVSVSLEVQLLKEL
jgi:polyisoprenoid-binding protein YceI